MSLYLLDTHALIWAAMEPRRLSAKVRRLIVDPKNAVAVSTISFWEISLKHALGKLALSGCVPEDLPGVVRVMGFDVVAPAADECASFHRLPRLAHKDPFDRMLVWQSIGRQATLVSKDASLRQYESAGLSVVW